MKRLIARAKELSRGLDDPHEALRILSAILSAVIIHPAELKLHLQREKLARLLEAETTGDDQAHVITSPCKLAHLGQELKFILPVLGDQDRYSRRDRALITAVAKAHLWWRWITDGEVGSLSEIAKRENIDKGQVTRWLRLAFLSPVLVRQIRAGTQPACLTLETLTRQLDLPLAWDRQQALIAMLD
jgi:hypothetical protein